jgi:hypothetical protein
VKATPSVAEVIAPVAVKGASFVTAVLLAVAVLLLPPKSWTVTVIEVVPSFL